MSPKISLVSLVKRFGSFTAVDGIDLDVSEGELLGLLGPSGCGKTTTLNIIAGFEYPTGGQIMLDGTDIAATPAHKRGMGIVFQSYALFPHLTAAENVAFGLEMRNVERADKQKLVAWALDLVRLSAFSDRYPRQLSGGQQQRVALARAIAFKPNLLLLDEPLSNLDAKLREDMQVELRAIQKSVGITTIMVTHDQAEALSICDRIAIMDKGKIVQFGTPRELYDLPATDFVANFVGRTNRLSGRVLSRGEDEVVVGVDATDTKIRLHEPSGAVEGNQKLLLALRPEKLRFTESGGKLSGTLRARVFLGNSWLHQVSTSAGEMWVCQLNEGQSLPEEGSKVNLTWNDVDVAIIRP